MDEGRVGRLSWRTRTPFGADLDHDFRQPLTPEEQAAFRSLFYARRLLVMRGERLSLEQQQAVAGYIGPVLTGDRGLAYIAPDDGILNEARLAYHSDLAFAPEPFAALSLHAVDVAEGRTSTLPQALKTRIDGRTAIFTQPPRPDTRLIDGEPWDSPVRRARGVTMDHPVTGETLLFVNENHVTHVEGLEAAESYDLLDALFGHLYAPANRVEHVWNNGDLLLWDNLALQHGRPDVAGIHPRRLQRASVAERSLLEQMPEFFARRTTPR
jgi:taurine dioxygenase